LTIKRSSLTLGLKGVKGMSATGLEVFDTTLHKTHTWLKEVMEELGTEDRHRAYMALRAVLHALRDRLTVEEVAQLSAQLPMLVRGFFYEGWDPTGKPLKERHLEAFLAHVAQELKTPSGPAVDPEKAARAVFKVLAHRISQGEIADIRGLLPKELRALWPE
jgi:uncharacterized protein (DUF2267 family)